MRVLFGRGPKGRAAVIAVLAASLLFSGCKPGAAAGQKQTAATFAMDTLITQDAYGVNAEEAMRQVNLALAEQEARLSLFKETGDIASVNRAAGEGGAAVSPKTEALLRQALSLSAQSEGAFAITVAPLTLAWGITTDHPRVVPEAEREQLLQLVDDSAVTFQDGKVSLSRAGMGLDLGGIAKGAACNVAAAIYEEYEVDNALLSIGGNVYARGTKPGGQPWKVGFRDPQGDGASYIASFDLEDEVIAVSGGYERYFEEDGIRYIHILDPRTGAPAQSDILSVGVIDKDGAAADFWSTTLYIWGVEKAVEFIQNGGKAIVLDKENRLFLPKEMEKDFALYPEKAGEYALQFVTPKEAP